LNRVAALGEMVTSLAHELNQPLAAILTNAEAASQFLNRESPNLARIRGCLTAIAADDERAAGVIKRLRALLKKDQSQVSLIDLNEVLSDALRLVNNDAMLRETRVRIEPHPKLPPVLGDRVQLCQVVLNLLVNGLQAAAEQPPAERWVWVRTAEALGYRTLADLFPPRGRRSSVHQKAYRGESGISQGGWGIANDSGLRGDEQDPQKADPVAGKRRCRRAGPLHQSNVRDRCVARKQQRASVSILLRCHLRQIHQDLG
jgi:phospho-acceptor domain-containing protein